MWFLPVLWREAWISLFERALFLWPKYLSVGYAPGQCRPEGLKHKELNFQEQSIAAKGKTRIFFCDFTKNYQSWTHCTMTLMYLWDNSVPSTVEGSCKCHYFTCWLISLMPGLLSRIKFQFWLLLSASAVNLLSYTTWRLWRWYLPYTCDWAWHNEMNVLIQFNFPDPWDFYILWNITPNLASIA